MTTPTGRDAAIRTLGDLIRDIKVAMLTTVASDGMLRSRPMVTQQVVFDGDLWFFTRADSAKADEVRRDEGVNLSYADPDAQHFVSVSGTARLVRDRRKAEELWHPLLRAWFPQGLDDPDLALLKVVVVKAESWDAPSSTMVHIVGFVRALATGRPYEPGEHDTMTLDESSSRG